MVAVVIQEHIVRLQNLSKVKKSKKRKMKMKRKKECF